MDKLVHFELPVTDMARAKEFYSSIFGWKLSDWPMPDGSNYVGIHTVDVDETTRIPKEPGAINGGMVMRSATVPHPTFAIHVASIDDRLKQIEAAGGSIVVPKFDMSGMGFLCYVKDPEGNVISLWQDPEKK